jgi:hypothetical protein
LNLKQSDNTMAVAHRHPRRFVQFGLRTFLIAVTVLCIWLGWQTYRAEQQRRAVALIRAFGGGVHYDFESLEGDEWTLARLSRRFLGPDLWNNVEGVNLVMYATVHISSDGDKLLRPLEEIDPSSCVKVLEHLPSLSRLKRLQLGILPIDDSDLAWLAKLARLEHLTLYMPGLTDAGLVHLESLQNLRFLEMDYTSVTQSGIDRLQRALPKCRIEW